MVVGLADRAGGYVHEFCTRHRDRHMGGRGNRAATAFFAATAADLGLEVESTSFECIDWRDGGASLAAGSETFGVLTGCYSLPCDVTAPLAAVSTVEELEAGDFAGTVLLVHGGLAREQLTPKGFVFYNPDSHKRIVAAIVAATGKNPSLVGSLYPFPFVADGDFDIPNAYMKDVEGTRLLLHVGRESSLRIGSERVPSGGDHVVARSEGTGGGRVVVFGHIDSTFGSPGALDNATGAAMLLALGELLADSDHGPSVELVPLNGEDDYSAAGQMLWVRQNEGRMGDIVLGVNIDGAGCAGQATAVSMYGCPEPIEAAARELIETHGGMAEGEAWYQSDHGIFMMYERPAMALTSANLAWVTAEVTHTAKDAAELVDPGAVAEAAVFLRDLVAALP